MEVGKIFVNILQIQSDGGKDGWRPESNSKLDCVVKIRSMHEKKYSKIRVGLLISWLRPNWDVRFSIVRPSKLLLSWLHQCFDFALKSPMTTIKKGSFALEFPSSLQDYLQFLENDLGSD